MTAEQRNDIVNYRIELGRFYSVAFSKRSAGDYEDFITHTRETVMELYPQAERFVECVKNLLSEN